MKIVTWNVNSIRARLSRLLDWLIRNQPDIVCLQETKVIDADFPQTEINAIGYQCTISGQKSYNGVAILSRSDPKNVISQLPGDANDKEKRFLAAEISGIQIINVYVPNGSEIDSDKYKYKLNWYYRLRDYLDTSFTPEQNLLICGDFNVAPDDRDVWDVKHWTGQLHFSEPEKEAHKNLVNWGLKDALRLHYSDAGIYTWWDYRSLGFQRGLGLRIDHILLTNPLTKRCIDVVIDRNERKGEKPSDHAPVTAIFTN
ncbi:MAG: exodeoxyribonuclease III [Blastocatellia bacterium]|jgi:exodeoxyribonuclease-3